jgi:hypothetical protein
MDPSQGFICPALDGSITLTEMYVHHALHTPDWTLFVYDNKSMDGVEKIGYRHAVSAIDHVTLQVMHGLEENREGYGERAKNAVFRPTIAILATAGMFRYFLSL